MRKLMPASFPLYSTALLVVPLSAYQCRSPAPSLTVSSLGKRIKRGDATGVGLEMSVLRMFSAFDSVCANPTHLRWQDRSGQACRQQRNKPGARWLEAQVRVIPVLYGCWRG